MNEAQVERLAEALWVRDVGGTFAKYHPWGDEHNGRDSWRGQARSLLAELERLAAARCQGPPWLCACGGRLCPTLRGSGSQGPRRTKDRNQGMSDCSATWDKSGDLADWPEWDRQRVAALKAETPLGALCWDAGSRSKWRPTPQALIIYRDTEGHRVYDGFDVAMDSARVAICEQIRALRAEHRDE